MKALSCLFLSCLSFMAGCSCEQCLHLRSLSNVSGPFYCFILLLSQLLLISHSSIFLFSCIHYGIHLCVILFSTRLFLHGLTGFVGDSEMGSFFIRLPWEVHVFQITKCKHLCHFERAELHAYSMSC
ncbi:hypothetical protein BDQ94DRAFT_45131 [Aspergillus welwitschiae]|uniref:Secreted protein n=1 Tax=Aspergillus welwitschiae TaxID=1341132 RepID=A0A3F3QGY7_9EURO|nr:hypothetical protein BDQ94DRAFT_45131 [Aspergillus welwitschiae]RDH38548.1 hypothetical protein BDQ94DRAFT_45131 [Aspergillus welwitschiae]